MLSGKDLLIDTSKTWSESESRDVFFEMVSLQKDNLISKHCGLVWSEKIRTRQWKTHHLISQKLTHAVVLLTMPAFDEKSLELPKIDTAQGYGALSEVLGMLITLILSEKRESVSNTALVFNDAYAYGLRHRRIGDSLEKCCHRVVGALDGDTSIALVEFFRLCRIAGFTIDVMSGFFKGQMFIHKLLQLDGNLCAVDEKVPIFNGWYYNHIKLKTPSVCFNEIGLWLYNTPHRF